MIQLLGLMVNKVESAMHLDRSINAWTLPTMIIILRLLGWSFLVMGIFAFVHFLSAFKDPGAVISFNHRQTSEPQAKLMAMLLVAVFPLAGAVLAFIPRRLYVKILCAKHGMNFFAGAHMAWIAEHDKLVRRYLAEHESEWRDLTGFRRLRARWRAGRRARRYAAQNVKFEAQDPYKPY